MTSFSKKKHLNTLTTDQLSGQLFATLAMFLLLPRRGRRRRRGTPAQQPPVATFCIPLHTTQYSAITLHFQPNSVVRMLLLMAGVERHPAQLRFLQMQTQWIGTNQSCAVWPWERRTVQWPLRRSATRNGLPVHICQLSSCAALSLVQPRLTDCAACVTVNQ